MKKTAIAVSLAAMLGYTSTSHASSDDKTYVKVGDWIQILLPASALGVSIVKQDKTGTWQFVRSGVTTIAATHITKFAVDKRRPDDSASNSFPSGHTSAAFTGASFFYTRYGAAWGVPAYALAGYTGWSRVHGNKHYWDDVLAGAGIAVMSNLYFVNPTDEDIFITPHIDGDAAGVNVTVSNRIFESGSRGKNPQKNFNPKFRFELIMGPTTLKTNELDIENTTYANVDFVGQDDITTAGLKWSYQPKGPHSYHFFTQPYEVRAKGIVDSQPEIYTLYQVWDNQFNWMYDLSSSNTWTSKLGVGALLQRAELGVYNDKNYQDAAISESEWLFYPTAHVDLGYNFTPATQLKLNGQYGHNGSGEVASADLSLNYAFNQRWDIGGGYSYYQRDQNNAKTFQKIAFNSVFVRLGYAF